ncbi:hypothetical protein F5876DRAFT_67356 [Lentinula aff. lateritia]|uniref:Uncharacterized protein n=1 Tax=Lentinula aff. lateritia TaxID=2804960 RepID=A0ACC1TUB7_9AGAR|nr:hypothetical protein F5876DRAFT_67356 [Lentinula aff. lateritia]
MDTASDRIAEDFTWASLAFLYYDYGLTFDEEVEHIWGMNFSSSTLLYILCRYAMLANLLYLLAHLNKLGLRLGAVSCDTWYKIIAALAVLGRAAVIVTFTLRTYVVWAQSRIVLISLVMLGLATVLTDAANLKESNRCLSRVKPAKIPEEARQLDLVRSFTTIVFETLSATLILIRSLQAFWRGGSYFSQYKLIHFLMQEGAVYFWYDLTRPSYTTDPFQAKISIVSLFTIATFVLKLSTESKYLHDLLNAFTLPLSGLLTARFLLHLRAWNKARSSAPTAIDINCQNAPDPDWRASSISTLGIQSVFPASLNSELTSAWITTAEYGEDPMLKAEGPVRT